MSLAGLIKILGGFCGVIVAVLFPTELLKTLMYCLIGAGSLDCITGVAAAIEKHEAVTPKAFIKKAMRKGIRGMTYLGLAAICGQVLKVCLERPHPVLEPFGAVLGALIGADTVSILRNLSIAKMNIPILDRMFKRLLKHFAQQADEIAKDEPKEASE